MPAKASTPTIVLILAIVTVYILTMRPGQAWYGDFSLYIAHARNIAEAKPYADTGYMRNPDFALQSPQAYPPVFPLLLAPVYALFGLNLAAMKVLVIVMFGLALWVIDRGMCDRLDTRQRLVVLALLGMCPSFWLFSDNIVSDLPFLFFTYLGLWLYQLSTEDRGRSERASIVLGVAAGVAMYLAYGTRSVGLVLMPCILAHAWWHKRRLDGPVAAAFIPMAAGAVIQSLIVGSASQYLEAMSIYAENPLVGLKLVGATIHDWTLALVGIWDFGQFLPSRLSMLGTVVAGLVVIAFVSLAIVGYVLSFRRRRTVFELFPIFYLLIVLPWPLAQDPRFLYPLIPLGVIYALLGWQWAGDRWPVAKRPYFAVVILCVLLTGYAGRYLSPRLLPDGANVIDADATAMFQWVKDNTDSEDVLVCSKPRILALYTGRRCTTATPVANPQVLIDYLYKSKADYLVVLTWWGFDNDLVKPFVGRYYAQSIVPVYQDKNYWVYRIELPPQPAKTSGGGHRVGAGWG